MTLDPELRSLFAQTCVVYPWASDDAGGAATYGTGTTHPARIVRRTKIIKGVGGRDVISTTQIYLATSSTGGEPNLTPRSKLVPSDGSEASILSVARHVDDDGSAHHEVAYCG